MSVHSRYKTVVKQSTVYFTKEIKRNIVPLHCVYKYKLNIVFGN